MRGHGQGRAETLEGMTERGGGGSTKDERTWARESRNTGGDNREGWRGSTQDERTWAREIRNTGGDNREGWRGVN